MDFTPGQGPLEGREELNKGNSIVLSPPPGVYNANGEVVGQRRTIVKLVSRGLGAASLGVALGLTLEGQPNDSQAMLEDDFILPMVQLEVRWGQGGCHYRTEYDLMTGGTQFAVSAEDIEISARYIRITRPWDPSPATLDKFPTYRVNSGFGYLSTGKNSNPARLTKVVQLQGPNSKATFQIPDFAISATLLTAEDSRVIAQVIPFGANYNMTYSQPTPDAGDSRISNRRFTVENSIPLFNGARFIQIANDQDRESFGFLVFGLSFG